MAYTPRFPSGSSELWATDNARSSLASSISDSAVTIVVSDQESTDAYANMPQGDANNEAPFPVTIENEKILCHSRSGDTITVWQYDLHGAYDTITGAGETGRGYDGSSAAAHTIGSSTIQVYVNVVSKILREINDAIAALESNKAADSAVVHNTGDESIAGIKTFEDDKARSTTNAAPSNDLSFANKKYVDDQIDAVSTAYFLGNGSDGALNLTSGTTNINSNTIYQYSSISISGTGKLSTADTEGLMMIMVLGNVTLSVADAIDFSAKSRESAVTYTLLGGDTVDFNAPANGGAGGAGETNGGAAGGSGGAQGGGYGGGGGGGGRHSGGTNTGGDGGAGGAPVGAGGAGGVMGDTLGKDGSNSSGGGGGSDGTDPGGDGGGSAYGTNGNDDPGGANTGAGGGCGGEAGACGLPVVINVGGNYDASSGGINVSGGNGGDGGDGGAGFADGGGGGGGGGGDSADVLLRYVGTYAAGTDDFSGGTAGSGGSSTGGTNGSNGSAGGGNGSLTTRKIVNLI